MTRLPFVLCALLLWCTLAAAQMPQGRVVLRWEQPASLHAPIMRYAVWKAPGHARRAWVRLPWYLPATARVFVDYGVEPGETWYYGVQAVGADGAVSKKAVVQVVIPRAQKGKGKP